MAKKLICVVVGLMIATTASAYPVDPNASDGVAAQYVAANSAFVTRTILCTDGQVFEITVYHDGATEGWNAMFNVPVSVSEIKDWTPSACITHDGRIYFRIYDGIQETPWTEWSTDSRFPEPPCGGIVGSDGNTIDSLKSMFR